MAKRKDLRRYLSKKERTLVDESSRYDGRVRLRERVKLYRKLRDKYRDLARRQKIEQRGKVPGEFDTVSEGRSRTVQKAEYFARHLDHFREELEKAEAPFRDPDDLAA